MIAAMNDSRVKRVPILGIELASVTISEAVDYSRLGGLILAPSGPGLCDLSTDPDYRQALRQADLNLPDSGLAILMMRLLGMGALPRTSGLGFLEGLLQEPYMQEPGVSFWIMPSKASMERNLVWLKKRGIRVTEEDCYVAPIYPRLGPVQDEDLKKILISRRPQYLFICTGSGTQEKLGFWFREQLPYRPAICCIGAAIGFLSGDQVGIPQWADRLCLGWLIRCLADPPKYLPRYFKSVKLIGLLLKYREQAPATIVS